MGEGNAWVTLATNDSYCLGALVLAHSLKRANTAHPMVILVTPGVTPTMRERLTHVFAEVISVDVMDSGDAAHLALLSRPELGITFTKLHCWNLTQYNKCVFLDADTLVLQNCDELFDREELSAAPDVGWPDCFNSGVFVYRPSNETFSSLLEFAKTNGSFDGGDQGLLNQYFSSWATGDISKHLSFLYNVCSTSFYSYLPALKQYGQNMKIVHFIGQIKPWLENFNWGSRSVGSSGTLQGPLQYWWDIFIEQVHPVLDVAMRGHIVDAASPALYTPPNPPQFPWHRPLTPPPSEHHHQESLHEFVDPWEIYPTSSQPNNEDNHQHNNNPGDHSNYFENTNTEKVEHYHHHHHNHQESTNNHVENQMNMDEIRNLYTTKAWYEFYTNEPEEEATSQIVNYDNSISQDDISVCGPGGSHCGTEYPDTYSQNDVDEFIYNENNDWHDDGCQEQHSDNDHMTTTTTLIVNEEIKPRHPYDNFYLLHQVVLGPKGHKGCTHDAPVVPEPPSPPPPPTPEEDTQAGVAGALSQMSIGTTESNLAMDEHLRRQGWEAGNIDYMGADAFDNIWAKISQTLSLAPASSGPATESSPSSEPASQPVSVPQPTSEAKSAPVPTASSESSLPESRTSIESISSGLASAVSDISISKPSSLENSSDSSFTTVSSVAASETKATAALKEEKPDHEQVLQQSGEQQPPIKPMGKLVCHLKAVAETEPLLTPESELEDAATLAQKIIASEEAVSSPVITTATPMTSPPICPLTSQNIKDLIVETAIPDTPPLSGSGPVSLAQIGITPSKPSGEPKTLVQLTESKLPAESQAVKESATKIEESKTKEIPSKVECKLSKDPKVQESSTESPKECKLPAKSDITKEKDSSKVACPVPESKSSTEKLPEETKVTVKKVKKVVKQKSSTDTPPKTPDAEGESKKLVCSLQTKDDLPRTLAEISLPKDLANVTLPKALEKAIVETSNVIKPDTTTVSDEGASPGDVSSKKDEAAAEAKPKVKKVVKKVPATPGSDAGKKSAEGPVPPPRKKVVKPKEK